MENMNTTTTITMIALVLGLLGGIPGIIGFVEYFWRRYTSIGEAALGYIILALTGLIIATCAYNMAIALRDNETLKVKSKKPREENKKRKIAKLKSERY